MLQVKDCQSFICSNFLGPHHEAHVVKVPEGMLDLKTTFTTFSSEFSWVLVSSSLNWGYYPPYSAVGVAVRIVQHSTYELIHTVTWRALHGGKRLLLYSGNKIPPSPENSRKPKLVYPFFFISLSRMHHYSKCRACSLSCQHF